MLRSATRTAPPPKPTLNADLPQRQRPEVSHGRDRRLRPGRSAPHPASPYQTAGDRSARQAGQHRPPPSSTSKASGCEETVLLRPEQPVYRVGEHDEPDLAHLQPQGTVYLDIVRDGQTVSTRAWKCTDGQAELVRGPDPRPVRHARAACLQNPPHPAASSATPAWWWSTAPRTLDLAADPRSGHLPPRRHRPRWTSRSPAATAQGVQAALGLAIVDESVFALAEQDPGFAKLYFLLEQRAAHPKYDLHGFSLPDLVERHAARRRPAAATRRSTRPPRPRWPTRSQKPFSFQPAGQLTPGRPDRGQQAADQTSSASLTMGRLLALLVLVPLGMSVLAGYSLFRKRVLGRSLLTDRWACLAFLVLLFLSGPWAPITPGREHPARPPERADRC